MKTTPEGRMTVRHAAASGLLADIDVRSAIENLANDLDEAIRERDEYRSRLGETNIALAKTQRRLSVERAHFECLLDQFEAECDGQGALMQSLADAERRIQHFRRLTDAQEEALDARDVAIKAAAAEVTAARADLAAARAGHERVAADFCAAHERAADFSGAFARVQQAVDEHLPDHYGPISTVDRIVLFAADMHKAESERADAERTLEAVREELRRVTKENDEARRRYDSAVDVSVRAIGSRSRVIGQLRRRLSEQAATIRVYENGGDPQRNVTQGLLRVEQNRSEYWSAMAIGQGKQIYDLAAEVERLARTVEGMSETIANQDAEVERLSAELRRSGYAQEVIDRIADGTDAIAMAAAKCATCDGTLATGGSCPTCAAAEGIAKEWSGELLAIDGAAEAILRHIGVEAALDRAEAEEKGDPAGPCGKCAADWICFSGHYACIKELT